MSRKSDPRPTAGQKSADPTRPANSRLKSLLKDPLVQIFSVVFLLSMIGLLKSCYQQAQSPPAAAAPPAEAAD